jgi:hypothetical protein
MSRRDRHKERWHDLYGQIVDSDQTIECRECGVSLFGDSVPMIIICLTCWMKTFDPLEELIDSAQDKAAVENPPRIGDARGTAGTV